MSTSTATRICFETGGANPFNEAKTNALITLSQRGENGHFTVTYGLHEARGLTYEQAARELGECIMHHCACEGRLGNEGE